MQGASKTDGYQLSGGKFMLIYLGLLALIAILLLVISSLTLAIYCCLKSDNKSNQPDERENNHSIDDGLIDSANNSPTRRIDSLEKRKMKKYSSAAAANQTL